jgi:hypothetical protein
MSDLISNKVKLEVPAVLSPEEIQAGCRDGALPFDRVLVTLASGDAAVLLKERRIREVAQAALNTLGDPTRPFPDSDIIQGYPAIKARLEQMECNCAWLMHAIQVIVGCLRPGLRAGTWRRDVVAAVHGAQSAKRLLDTMRQERPRDPKQAQQDTTDLTRYEAGLFLATIHDMVFGELETRTDDELIREVRKLVEFRKGHKDAT